MKGLMGLMGKDMGGDEPPASGSEVSTSEDEYLDDAFDAMGKDRKAFRAAMKGAIRACIDNYGPGEEGEG